MALSKVNCTTFQQSYLGIFPWVKADPKSITSAICTWCNNKQINIGSMGKSALTSHAAGSKHKAAAATRAASLPLSALFASRGSEGNRERQFDRDPDIPLDQDELDAAGNALERTTDSTPVTPQVPSSQGPSTASGGQIQPPAASAASSSSGSVLQRFLLGDAVTKAEIRWCLQTVMSHHSFRSAAADAATFAVMFPDSEIAKKIELGRTKIAYTLVHGIAPRFKRLLQNDLDKCNYIVVGFDESMNKVSKTQQMDILVRFWDTSLGQATSRYFDSAFLTASRASDLKQALRLSLGQVNFDKVIQISMDGPAVNFKLLNELKAEVKEERKGEMLLVDIGLCGLHVTHGSFKAAVKALDWGITDFLISLFYLFNESPARRGHFMRNTGSSQFPLQWSAVRWVENRAPAQRALSILPNIIKWVEIVMKEKSKNPLNKNHRNFNVVSHAVKDKLLPAKLSFFINLASLVEPFLTTFQTDDPMAPFLHRELTHMTIDAMSRVVKKSVMESTTSPFKVDLKDEKNLLTANELKEHLGFETRGALLAVKADVKSLDILKFKNDCRSAYIALVEKLLESSPLTYKLTIGLSCLDPLVISESVSVSEKRMLKCLDYMSTERRIIPGAVADKIISEYRKLCSITANLQIFASYDRKTKRLDHLWHELTAGPVYEHLASFVKIIMILSHGNAALERGFSVNKECLIENQSEKSLVALRTVHNHVLAIGGLDNLEIDKPLIHAARNASSAYKESLKRQKEEDLEKSRAAKRRKEENERIAALKAQKEDILKDAAAKVAVIEELLKN